MNGSIRVPELWPTAPRLAAAGLLALLLLAGCAPRAGAGDGAVTAEPRFGRITGTAVYSEEVWLPPEALLTVSLVETPVPGHAGRLLGRSTVPTGGPPPFRFVVRYDRALVREAGSYSLEAQVVSGDQVLFATPGPTPVQVTPGPEQVVDLLLVPRGPRRTDSPGR